MPSSVYPSHPPPYGTDQAPAYELQERPGLVPRSTGSTQTLDDATIESCAPKPPPRRFVWTRKIKIWTGVALLALVGLLSAMIWLGVKRKREKANASPADLSLATSTLDPWVPSSLIPADGTLLSPFNFSYPTALFIPSDDASHTSSNYTVLSSSQLINLNANTSLAIKIFGYRSSQVTFRQGNETSSDTVVDVTALWRVFEGWNETSSRAWGLEELSKTAGGLYGTGEGVETSGNGVILGTLRVVDDQDVWESGSRDSWRDALVFNITVTFPPTTSIANLTVFAESEIDINFGDLANTTIDVLDVRAPNGYVSSDSEAGITAQSIEVLAGSVILGRWNTYRSLLFNSYGVIQTDLNFLPSPSSPPLNIPFSATLIAKDFPGNYSGYLSANITSLPSNSNLTFNAVSTNSSTKVGMKVQFPENAFTGSWEVATNEGRAAVSEESIYGATQLWNEDGKMSYLGTTTVGDINNVAAVQVGGNGTIKLDAGRGDVQLVFGERTTLSGFTYY